MMCLSCHSASDDTNSTTPGSTPSTPPASGNTRVPGPTPRIPSQSDQGKPRSGHTIYIFGYNISEEVIKKTFSSFGNILNINMEVDNK